MNIVIGLGNPGQAYQSTRHNIGATFVKKLAGSVQWQDNSSSQLQVATSVDRSTTYILPQTYMNESGKAILYIKKKFPKLQPEELYVFHDDLDIAVGSWKLQYAKGPHEHNGLLSLYQAWGSKDFWHVRIGVDGRQKGRVVTGKDYVLQSFAPTELALLDQAYLDLQDQLQSQLQSD